MSESEDPYKHALGGCYDSDLSAESDTTEHVCMPTGPVLTLDQYRAEIQGVSSCAQAAATAVGTSGNINSVRTVAAAAEPKTNFYTSF